MYKLIRVHLITIFPGKEGVYELLEIIGYIEGAKEAQVYERSE